MNSATMRTRRPVASQRMRASAARRSAVLWSALTAKVLGVGTRRIVGVGRAAGVALGLAAADRLGHAVGGAADDIGQLVVEIGHVAGERGVGAEILFQITPHGVEFVLPAAGSGLPLGAVPGGALVAVAESL